MTISPTSLFTLHGVTYYEHPTLGDEAALLVKVAGVWCETDYYDRPDDGEARQMAAEVAKGDLSLLPSFAAVDLGGC